MKSLARFLGLLLPLISAAVSATDAFPPEFKKIPLKRIVAAENPYFGQPEPAIRKMLLARKRNGSTNHLCVVGYAWSSDEVHDVTVWVHWREAQRLLLWGGNSNKDERENGLFLARRNLKLGEDTVEKAEDLNGSTYLVTRTWWQAVSNDCALHG